MTNSEMLERYRDSVAKEDLRAAKLWRDRLVGQNLGLVSHIARRTMGSRRWKNEHDKEEAQQDGALGLMKAIEVFDPTRGSFSTCAVFWIRYYVQECLKKQTQFEKQRHSKMPKEVLEATAAFRALHGRDPGHEDLLYRGEPISAVQWKEWVDQAHVVSFDMLNTSNDDGMHKGYGHGELIADERTNPDITAADANLHDLLERELSSMSPRQRKIIQEVFVEGRNMAAVAAEYGIPKQRVHEIKKLLEARLKKALKRPSYRPTQ